jgi:Predicted dioxygenase
MFAPGAKGISGVRPPAAAGLYYPLDADGLRTALRTLLAASRAQAGRTPKALVVPHSGYAYSGEVAAAGYHTLDRPGVDGTIRHVVLLGPSHRLPIHGMAMPSYESFATPFGVVPIDDAARTRLRELSLAGVSNAPHAFEHSLEVQLPFLQALLTGFDVLPIAVGIAPPAQVDRALETVWGGPDTLIVVSSDLSHHHTQHEAQVLDEQTARLILARSSDISDTQACGAGALNGLMEAARHKRLEVQLLDRRTSGDTTGDDSRVVGYGSFALYEPE